MSGSRKKTLRLLSVMAMVVTMLVPAATASAGGGFTSPYWCDGINYDPANPAHHLAGQMGGGWTVVDGYMVIDLSGATQGQVVFWNGDYPFGVGSPGGMWVTGSPFNDTICGTRSDDYIMGKGGDDRIFAHEGDTDYEYDPVTKTWGGGDQLFGNSGNDLLWNGAGDGGEWTRDSEYSALLNGGTGHDSLYAGNGGDQLFGKAGDDLLDMTTTEAWYAMANGGKGDDTMLGGEGRGQVLKGKGGADTIKLGSGDDQVANGGGGPDTIWGGTGDDQMLYGKKGDDTFKGGNNGCDNFGQVMFGGPGNDTFTNLGDGCYHEAYGGSGDDTFTPHDGDPTTPGPQTDNGFEVFGGGGDDNITGGSENDGLFGGSGDDVIGGGAGPDWIHGGPGNDVLDGGADRDRIQGNSGDDVVLGGSGDDELFGGDDNDLDWSASDPAGFWTGSPICSKLASDIVDDEFWGGGGPGFTIYDYDCDGPSLADGDDQLWGGTGNDDIDGGTGSNIMYANAPLDGVTGNPDMSDGEVDEMYGWSDNDDPATFNTYYGHCGVPFFAPGDEATDFGDGTADRAFDAVDDAWGDGNGIEIWVSACRYDT